MKVSAGIALVMFGALVTGHGVPIAVVPLIIFLVTWLCARDMVSR